MKAILNGILVVLVTLALAVLFIPNAKAGTPNELLAIIKDKQVIHYGTCTLDKANKLVPSAKGVKDEVCMVFASENAVHYVVFLDKKGEAIYVLRAEMPSFKQEIVWKRGKEI